MSRTGVSDEMIEYYVELIILFSRNPNKVFSFNILQEHMADKFVSLEKKSKRIKFSATTLSKVLNSLTDNFIVKKIEEGKKLGYQCRVSSDIDQENDFVNMVLKDDDIPPEKKAYILFPSFHNHAYKLYGALIENRAGGHDFQVLAKIARKAFFETLEKLPKNEHDRFMVSLSKYFASDPMKLMLENKYDFLREENNKNIGITKKSNSASHSKVSRRDQKAIKV